MNAIFKLLGDIIDKEDPPDLARDVMLRHAIDFVFVLCLEITNPVFFQTAVASNDLQKEGLNPSTAYKVIDGLLHTLNIMRSEERFTEIFGLATEKAKSLGIEVSTVVP
ncbi:Hypothetical protein FKW44_003441, partial [Caligus rogercresseyi]